jgi:hypothetical protein
MQKHLPPLIQHHLICFLISHKKKLLLLLNSFHLSELYCASRIPRGLCATDRKFLAYTPSIQLPTRPDRFGNTKTCFWVRLWIYIFFSPLLQRGKKSRPPIHWTNTRWTTGTGLCEHAFGSTGCDCENKFRIWNVAYEMHRQQLRKSSRYWTRPRGKRCEL